MRFVIILVILFLSSINTFACSNKDQFSITISDNKESNFTHNKYVIVGKKIFNDNILSKKLHSYNMNINHSAATITFDIDNNQIKNQIFNKIKNILEKENLKNIRITHNKLINT